MPDNQEEKVRVLIQADAQSSYRQTVEMPLSNYQRLKAGSGPEVNEEIASWLDMHDAIDEEVDVFEFSRIDENGKLID